MSSIWERMERMVVMMEDSDGAGWATEEIFLLAADSEREKTKD